MPSKFWTFYALLLLLRLFFACSHSYIHPDEMFQGSEIIVGDVFGWATLKTWEFTSSSPIRSIVPIYILQAPLLYLLRTATSHASPKLIFYTLRIQQFLWSFVIDALLYAVSQSRNSLLLFASSYTTLTYQTHTFSNSWESILVLGSLYASQSMETSLALGLLTCLGMFTRISFAAFMIPLAIVRLRKMVVWSEESKSWTIYEQEIQLNAFMALTFIALASIVVYLDTIYYTGLRLDLISWNQAVYTVWNNIRYNADPDNLAQHGLHSRYTHLINLVVLLGPALFMVRRLKKNIYTASMACGLLTLSFAPHQEARFLLPCVVLFFAGLKVPRISKKLWSLCIIFNVMMALFMGVFHQCGVIPAALHISETYPAASITWTKSYPAPKLLLGPDVQITHVYGGLETAPTTDLYVAPISHHVQYPDYELVYQDTLHVNLDDLDVLGFKVFQERGLGIYKHSKYRP